MTRKGSTRTVDTSFGTGRLSIARAYLKAARNELLVADSNDVGNPAMSQIVNAQPPLMMTDRGQPIRDRLAAPTERRPVGSFMDAGCSPLDPR